MIGVTEAPISPKRVTVVVGESRFVCEVEHEEGVSYGLVYYIPEGNFPNVLQLAYLNTERCTLQDGDVDKPGLITDWVWCNDFLNGDHLRLCFQQLFAPVVRPIDEQKIGFDQIADYHWNQMQRSLYKLRWGDAD